jgi:signal transduction histidine kinase
MSIELEQVGQMLPTKFDALSGRIKELQRKAGRISQEIHRMSYKLHPSKLDHLGLVPALKSFCSELADRRLMRVNFQHEGAAGSLPADVTLCLFRVAQEALHNSAKHSGGSQVDVVLSITEAKAKLTVSDAGCGFDMNNGKMTEGLGFVSMRERLRLVNGSLDIQARPLAGTRVNVIVPLLNVVSVRPIS